MTVAMASNGGVRMQKCSVTWKWFMRNAPRRVRIQANVLLYIVYVCVRESCVCFLCSQGWHTHTHTHFQGLCAKYSRARVYQLLCTQTLSDKHHYARFGVPPARNERPKEHECDLLNKFRILSQFARKATPVSSSSSLSQSPCSFQQASLISAILL